MPTPGMTRVNFELEEDVARRLQFALVWGTKGPCLRVLATKLVEAVEAHGQVMVGAILDGQFELMYTGEMGRPDKVRPKSGRRRKSK